MMNTREDSPISLVQYIDQSGDTTELFKYKSSQEVTFVEICFVIYLRG